MKVSKVVLIVVALHVLVIGGIVVFEGCSRVKSNAPDMASNENPAGQPADMTSGTLATQTSSMPNPQGPGAATSLTPANSLAANEATPPALAPAVAPAPVASTTAQTYVVKKGDSLWKIAKAENLTVGELSRANNMTKTSVLKVGQKLNVPAKTEKATIATASVIPTSTDASSAAAAATAPATTSDVGGATYTVKSGDSLWKIARQQNVSVAVLKQANSLTGDSLKTGQKLHIPAATAKAAADSAATGTTSASVASTSSAGWQEPGAYTENGQTTYVVGMNESPSTIAKKYGIKTEDLLKANNITDARKIQYGQKLVIPTEPSATASTTTIPATTPVANTTSTPAPVATAAPALAAPVVSASRTTVQ